MGFALMVFGYLIRRISLIIITIFKNLRLVSPILDEENKEAYELRLREVEFCLGFAYRIEITIRRDTVEGGNYLKEDAGIWTLNFLERFLRFDSKGGCPLCSQ